MTLPSRVASIGLAHPTAPRSRDTAPSAVDIESAGGVPCPRAGPTLATNQQPDDPIRLIIGSRLPAYAAGIERWATASESPPVVCTVESTTAGVVAAAQRERTAILIVTDDLDGAELARVLRDAAPETRLLVLATPGDLVREAKLVRAGADGLLPLDTVGSALMRAVRELAAGRAHISIQALRLAHQQRDDRRDLSPRQIEILSMLASGLTTREISDRLTLAPSTVKTHIARVGEKLGLQGRWAVACGAPRVLDDAPRPDPRVEDRRSGTTYVSSRR